jgi:hypothetical protein
MASIVTATARSTQVGTLIESFCSTLEQKMKARRFFYKSGTLIREGILTLSQHDFMTDLTNCVVDLIAASLTISLASIRKYVRL